MGREEGVIAPLSSGWGVTSSMFRPSPKTPVRGP